MAAHVYARWMWQCWVLRMNMLIIVSTRSYLGLLPNYLRVRPPVCLSDPFSRFGLTYSKIYTIFEGKTYAHIRPDPKHTCLFSHVVDADMKGVSRHNPQNILEDLVTDMTFHHKNTLINLEIARSRRFAVCLVCPWWVFFILVHLRAMCPEFGDVWLYMQMPTQMWHSLWPCVYTTCTRRFKYEHGFRPTFQPKSTSWSSPHNLYYEL